MTPNSTYKEKTIYSRTYIL